MIRLFHVYTVIITINFRFIINIKLVKHHSLCISWNEDTLSNIYYLKDMRADIYSLDDPFINLVRADWPQSRE